MADTYEHLHQHGRTAIAQLYNAATDKISNYDIAEMNLISAYALPGTDDLDVLRALQTLDEWATHIRKKTARALPLYHAHRDRFASRAQFNLAVLIEALTRDFGIRYNPEFVGEPMERPPPLIDPADTFIHGILGPRRMGTCASLPVVIVALGRRLGYPLKLALAPQHAFCRWDSARERFNIEFNEAGLNSHPDEHYREWPFKWPPQLHERERARPYFLVSMTSQQELATFAFNRAVSLDLVGTNRRKEALATMQVAQRLWPAHVHAVWLTHLTTKIMYPERLYPHEPCEETAGKAAMDRLVREKGAVIVDTPR